MLRRAFATLTLLLCWCLATVAQAATYDPDLRWRTLVTEHFRIHFHQGEERLADELAEASERILVEMSAELAWRLRAKVDVVLVDRTDRANGFATAIPANAITIFVTAPQEDDTLSLYESWTEAIFTHELTHVLHMETHAGIVAAARAIVGRIASTNAVSPWWVVEGFATVQETRHTDGGRGRSPYVDMMLRTASLEHRWPYLGTLDGLQARYPSGNLRYLFGQDFMHYVIDHTGEDVWTRWTHAYGRTIPWFLPAPKVFGRKLQGLWRDWREDRRQKYLAVAKDIATRGIRQGVPISDPEATCTSPSFSPDGERVVWSCYHPRTGSALWTAEPDGSGARVLKQDYGAKNFTWRSDGKAFVYAATHIVNRFNTWSDVYLFDVASRSTKALTKGARARDPEFSPDGSRLMVVTNKAQVNQLEVMTVDQRRTRLTAHAGETELATPRFAPSGRALALVIWEAGRRDLWLVSPTGERLRRLTADLANDRDPTWSPDGRWLLFSSDRPTEGGHSIPNIYAIDVATEHLWQVTNVTTGAARPDLSADGRMLAYEQYTNDGWEIRLMPFEPLLLVDRGPLQLPIAGAPSIASLVDGPAPSVDTAAVASWDGPVVRPSPTGELPPVVVAEAPRQDSDRIDTYEQTKVDDAFGEEQDYPFRTPPRRYNPWPTLAPRYWVPSFSLTPRLARPPTTGPFAFLQKLPPPLNLPGVEVTASTGARDALSRYAWSGWASYRTDANFFGGGGSVTINRWLPVFGFGASTSARPFTYYVVGPDTAVDDEGAPDFTSDDLNTVFMREINAYGTFQWPFTPVSTFFATYSFTDRALYSDLAEGAYMPSVALRGTIGNLSGGYSYSWNEPTPYAISAEDGRTFVASATVTAPWLGTFAVDEATGAKSGVTQVLLQADWREYVVNPAAPNHVFVFRAGAGVAFGGSTRFLGNYLLGGNGVGASRAIRGYPFGAARGDTYWLVGGEYRLPLWRIDRGFGTFPAFLRTLSGTIFLEAGNAFDGVQSVSDVFDGTLAGTGVELRLATVLGWSGSVDFRLGWATALTPGGYPVNDPRTVYFLFSGSL